MKPFVARDFEQLTKQLKKLPLRAYLEPGALARVQVSCQKSRLWHSGAVAERVEQVLAEHAGLRVDRPADRGAEKGTDGGADGGAETMNGVHLVYVRLVEDQVQVSLDVSGPRLSRRGYREHVAPASLRESLAAALVATVAFDSNRKPDTAFLWDPFCGAGTIVLEAAHFAEGRMPGEERHFAFERMRSFDQAGFLEFRKASAERNAAKPPWPGLQALGSDSSASVLQAAEHNLARARLQQTVRFLRADIQDAADQVPQNALVLTNPPYGKRLKKGAQGKNARVAAVDQLLGVLEKRPDLRPVVALLGGTAREQIPKDRVALFRTKNGGLPVSARLLRG